MKNVQKGPTIIEIFARSMGSSILFLIHPLPCMKFYDIVKHVKGNDVSINVWWIYYPSPKEHNILQPKVKHLSLVSISTYRPRLGTRDLITSTVITQLFLCTISVFLWSYLKIIQSVWELAPTHVYYLIL